MSTSKEYKAVRNCILNELHLTKEDIIKNIEPLLEKLVKRCMHNTYGGNNQIENWIRCMVNDELKQKRRLWFCKENMWGGYKRSCVEWEPEDKNDPDVHKAYEAGMYYIYSN